jgi:hypothetical protein
VTPTPLPPPSPRAVARTANPSSNALPLQPANLEHFPVAMNRL